MSSSSLAPVLLVAMPQLQDPNFHRAVVLLVEHSSEGALGLVLNRDGDLRLADLCDSLEIQWTGDPDASTDWGGPVEPNKGWMLFSSPPPELLALEHEHEHETHADASAGSTDTPPHTHTGTNGDSTAPTPLDALASPTNGHSDDEPPSPADSLNDASAHTALTSDSIDAHDLSAEELSADDLALDDDEDEEDDDLDAHEILDGVYFGVTLDTLRSVAEHSSGRFRLFLGYAGWGPGQLENEMARGDWIVAPADADCVFNCPNEQLWTRVISSLGVDPTHLISTAGIH